MHTYTMAADAWLTARGSSLFELLGFIFGVLAVALTVRQRVAAWPVGMINAALYAEVFRRAGLYSDAGLQLVYVVLAVYGWWHWRRGDASGEPLPVTRTPARDVGVVALSVLAGWLLLATITARLPGTSLPWLDSALVAGSLGAQWLTARKRLESWAVWLVLDTVYVGLFVYKGLLLTAVLYAVFWALAVQGHRAWEGALHARLQSPRHLRIPAG